jgi:hypothetical protein
LGEGAEDEVAVGQLLLDCCFELGWVGVGVEGANPSDGGREVEVGRFELGFDGSGVDVVLE